MGDESVLILAEYAPLEKGGHLKNEVQLHAYNLWRRLAEEGSCPNWSEFDPASLWPHLASLKIYVVDIEDPRSDPECALMGEACRDGIGISMTGKTVSQCVPGANGKDLVKRLRETASLARPTYVAKNMSWNARPWLNYSALFLPFFWKGTEVKILSVMTFEDLRPGHEDDSAESMTAGHNDHGDSGGTYEFWPDGRAGTDRFDGAELR